MSAARKVRASATPAGTAARRSARHAAQAVMRTGCRGPAVAPIIRSCPVFGWPEATTLLRWGKRERIRPAACPKEPTGPAKLMIDIARASPPPRRLIRSPMARRPTPSGISALDAIRPFRWKIALTYALTLVEDLLELSYPWATGVAINGLIEHDYK